MIATDLCILAGHGSESQKYQPFSFPQSTILFFFFRMHNFANSEASVFYFHIWDIVRLQKNVLITQSSPLATQLTLRSVSHREVVIFIFCLNCCRGRKVTRHSCALWLALSHFITKFISAQAKKWSEAVVAHLNNSSKYRHILKKIQNF